LFTFWVSLLSSSWSTMSGKGRSGVAERDWNYY
jgi:hypothetical protein